MNRKFLQEQVNADYNPSPVVNVLLLPPIRRSFSLKRQYIEPVLFLLSISLGLFGNEIFHNPTTPSGADPHGGKFGKFLPNRKMKIKKEKYEAIR